MPQADTSPSSQVADAVPASPEARPLRYWPATVTLVLAALIARVAYLAFVYPYELAGDEAHYWDWSRHLSPSYYSKGPGIAWAIAASTRLFGSHVWSVRLPSVLFGALGALVLARLTRAVSGSDKAGFVAAALFTVVPAYQATAILATIDGPFIAWWIISLLAGWAVTRRLQTGRAPLLLWASLGLALGVGFLFKYTILLLIPNLLLFVWLARRELHWDAHAWLGAAVAAAAFAFAASPVVIWNAQHGWPALQHEAGHLGLGGDQAGFAWTLRPDVFLALLGSQLVIIGPSVLRGSLEPLWPWLRRTNAWTADLPRLFLACASLPSLVFFVALSCVTEIEGNWPIALYTALIAVAAWEVVRRERIGRPERRVWRFALGWGLIAWVVIWFPGLVTHLPRVGPHLSLQRINGQRDVARRVQALRAELTARYGAPPIVVTDSYQTTSLLAFYLPDQPTVYSAMHQVGGRRSSYDFFPDTNLAAPQLRGRCAILVGGKQEQWQRAFVLSPLVRAGDSPPIYWAAHYDGLRSSPPGPR